MSAAVAFSDVADVTPDGMLSFDRFHEGQRRAFWSDRRFTLILAGTQGGKTAVGPPWLVKQIAERGPGDYLIGAPNFPLMEKKALPEFRRLFGPGGLNLGDYTTSPIRRFRFSRDGERRLWGKPQSAPTQVYFGYGEDPESLEAATIKAAWLDEPGQKKFKRESWESILRRLSIEEGPVLLTTTPYVLGWLKQELFDKQDDPAADILVVNFPSIANPRFPRSEWERAKRTLPAWKFTMFYRGQFERPAGLIYDCWSDENVIPAFAIPEHWPRFLGMDFGGVHMAGLFVAKELDGTNTPTGRLIAYREYLTGGKTIGQHAADLLHGEPRIPIAVGGAKSEDQYRRDFGGAGLGIWAPVVDEVEAGINRVYDLIQTKRFIVFDTLAGFRDEVTTYSRELDETGEPTEKIEDKETFHRLDAARYILSYLWLGLDGSLMA